MRRAALIAVVLLAALGSAPAHAAVTLQTVGTFAQPVYATGAPGDLDGLFVVEKAGRIKVLRNGTASTFLDISDRVVSSGEEQGLLSVAFAPDYPSTGRFYVYYTAPDLVISEFRRTGADHADATSERRILTIPHSGAQYHNGGQLQIGPDGMLWLATGDAQTGTNAQDLGVLLGKVLRIDPAPGNGCGGQCTIPAGNPGFARPEIWAYGLRNPWRFSFDRQTGDLFIGDVGDASYEEIDYAPAPGRGVGANYGWPMREGLHPGPGAAMPASCCTSPVIERGHGDPDRFTAIAGGYVVRDPALPDLLGRYLYADTYNGHIRAVTIGPGGATDDVDTGLVSPPLVSFGEDTCGRVYVVDLDGPVSRLSDSGACVPPQATPISAPAPGPGAGSATGAPKLTLRPAARQRPWKTGVLRLTARCDAACAVSVSGRFLLARRGHRAATTKLGTSTGRMTLAAGSSVELKLRVSAGTRRSLQRALRGGRLVTVRFAATALPAGAKGPATRRSATSRVVR